MKYKTIFKSKEGKEAILKVYDHLLSSWPIPFEHVMIDTKQGKTFCLIAGNPDAPPLFLLHGSGANSAIWREEIGEFAKHFRVYAIDIIGEPGRSDSNRPSHTGREYADWLMDIVSHLQIGKGQLYIVGMSLGGWMALKFASVYPEYTKRLALLCPGGITPIKVSFIMQSLLYLCMGEYGLRMSIRRVSYPHVLHPEVESVMVLIGKNFIYRSIPLFSDKELAILPMPILFIGGALDTLFSTKNSVQRLQKLVPQTDIHILPQAGHVLTKVHPIIIDFLT